MNQEIKRRVLIAATCLCLLAGCRQNTPEPGPSVSPPPLPSPTRQAEAISLDEFLAGVNESHRAATEGEPLDLSAYMTDHPEQSHTYTDEEMAVLTTYQGRSEDLTKEDLLADVDSCLTLLKTTYGAYDYFGGDEVFAPLMEGVKGELEALDAPTAADLENALANALAQVVRDGHFQVGKHALRDSFAQEMYYVPGLYFDDPAGRTMDYVKPTIGPDGRICYWYAALSHDGSDLPGELDGETLSWTRAGTIRSDGTVFRTSEQSGVPVLVSRAMWAGMTSSKEKQLERLAACGGDYADAPLLVFDVRGNGGGSDEHIMNWFEGWTGQNAPLCRLRRAGLLGHQDENGKLDRAGGTDLRPHRQGGGLLGRDGGGVFPHGGEHPVCGRANYGVRPGPQQRGVLFAQLRPGSLFRHRIGHGGGRGEPGRGGLSPRPVGGAAGCPQGGVSADGVLWVE